MGDKTIKEEVKKRMKEETPLTDKFQIGLSPITHLRKYLHKKQIIKENKAKVLKGEPKIAEKGWHK